MDAYVCLNVGMAFVGECIHIYRWVIDEYVLVLLAEPC